MILPYELIEIRCDRPGEYEVNIKTQTVTEYVQTGDASERFTYPNTVIQSLNYTVSASSEDEALRKVAEIVQRGI